MQKRVVATTFISIGLLTVGLFFQNCGEPHSVDGGSDPLAAPQGVDTWLRGDLVASKVGTLFGNAFVGDSVEEFSSYLQVRKLEEIQPVDINTMQSASSEAEEESDPGAHYAPPKAFALFDNGAAKGLKQAGVVELYAFQKSLIEEVSLSDFAGCNSESVGKAVSWDIEVSDSKNERFEGKVISISGTCLPDYPGTMQCMGFFGSYGDYESVAMFYELAPGGCAPFAK